MVAFKNNYPCVLNCPSDIKNFMNLTGLSQRAIAKAIGYSQAHLSSILSGKAKPTVRFFLAWSLIRIMLEDEFYCEGKAEVH